MQLSSGYIGALRISLNRLSSGEVFIVCTLFINFVFLV